MTEILNRFAPTLSASEVEVRDAVRDYVAWQIERRGGGDTPGEFTPGQFTPNTNDDVDIRTYLLELQIAGAGRKKLTGKIAALRRFYEWAKTEALIDSSPFEEFDFDRPLLSRDQIRRRQDRFGDDPREREIARLRALNRLADELNHTTDLQTTLDVTLATLVKTMGLQTAWIFLWTESGLTRYLLNAPAPHDFALCAQCDLPPGLVENNYYYLCAPPDCHCQQLLRHGLLTRAVNVVECTRLQDAADSAEDTRGLLFHATVPLIVQGKPLGLINVATDEWQFLSAADLQLLSAVGAQASVAIERARLFAHSAEYGAMEERNRLAREIHDTLAQGLTAITLQLETAEALLDAANAERARKSLAQALALARTNLDEARRTMVDLRAAPLEGRTLAEALKALADEWATKAGLPVDFEMAGEPRGLSLRVEAGLYRVAQEALTNVSRHAHAHHVRLRLTLMPDHVQLVVEDDGRGFDPSQPPKDRYGLIGLNERVKLLGGTLKLESSVGAGTRVEAHIPLERKV